MLGVIMRSLKYLITLALLSCAALLFSLPSEVATPSAVEEVPEFSNYNFRQEAEKLANADQLEEALILLEAALDFQTADHTAIIELHNEYLKKLAERQSALGLLQAHGYAFVTGEVNSFTELAASSVADFFIYGDLRDLTRELVFEDSADPFITSLSAAGLLTTAFPPADATASILKSARKTNFLTATLQQQITKKLKPLADKSAKPSFSSLKQAIDSLKPIYALAQNCRTWQHFGLLLKNCQNLKQIKFINKVISKPANTKKLNSILILLNKFPETSQQALGFVKKYGQKGMDALYGMVPKGPKALQFLIKNPASFFKLSKNVTKAHQLTREKWLDNWSQLKQRYGMLMEVVRYFAIVILLYVVLRLFKKSNKATPPPKYSNLNWLLTIVGVVLLGLVAKQTFGQAPAFGHPLSEPKQFTNETHNFASTFLFLIFIGAQIWVFLKVKKELKEVSKTRQLEHQSKMLDNAEFYFDLPIYLGLCGTVIAFILMTFDPSGSRLIAYSTTASGILLSAYMRGALLLPMKKQLVKNSE